MSGENWASILHGVVPSKHKVTNSTTAAYPENSTYPSILKIIEQLRPEAKVASIAHWANINKNIVEQSIINKPGNLSFTGNDDAVTSTFVYYVKTTGKDTRLIYLSLRRCGRSRTQLRVDE